MAVYGTFKYGEDVYGSDGVFPPLTGRVPWLFQSVHDSDIYELAINPLSAQMPQRRKNFNKRATTAGRQIISQGLDQVQTLTASGTLLTQEHHEEMLLWVNKEHQILITDDLNQKYWVLMTAYRPTRVHTPSFPWHHEYSFDATILNWA